MTTVISLYLAYYKQGLYSCSIIISTNVHQMIDAIFREDCDATNIGHFTLCVMLIFYSTMIIQVADMYFDED